MVCVQNSARCRREFKHLVGMMQEVLSMDFFGEDGEVAYEAR